MSLQKLALYRGIRVHHDKTDSVISKIPNDGLRAEDSQWRLPFPDVAYFRQRISDLNCKALLQEEDVAFAMEATGEAVSACGDIYSASFYAFRGSQGDLDRDYPLIIELSVPLDSITVDNKDFLCTSFQNTRKDSPELVNFRRNALARLFGPKILWYYDSAMESEDQGFRISLCRLAAVDSEVVLAHHKNRLVIGGRHGTLFRSAFFVRLPVPPDAISKIYRPERMEVKCEIDLHDFLAGNIKEF
jgi:hypothetical protein